MKIAFAIHNVLVNVMKHLPVMHSVPAILNVSVMVALARVPHRLAEKAVTMAWCSFLRLYFS